MTLDDLTFGGPFRLAQLRYLRDEGGFHRECRAPGTDISDLPEKTRKLIEEQWTREVVEGYREATRPAPEEPPAPTPPDPFQAILSKLGDIEKRLDSVESAAREEKKSGERAEPRGE